MSLIVLKHIELPNGESLGYRERAGGQDILVLVHGNMTSSKHWDVLMEKMPESYHIYAVDLRGFGESTYHQPIHSLRDFADDLRLFVDQLELQNFTLMGWSMGGGVSMQFTADHPEFVRKLVLLTSASTRGYPFYKTGENGMPDKTSRLVTKEEIAQDQGKTIPVLQAYQSRDKEFLQRLWNTLIYNTGKQPNAERYDEYIADMCTQRNLVDVYYALNTFNISNEHNGFVDGTGAAAMIKTPTLVLQGRQDLVVPEYMALEIMQDLGEHARLEYLDGCGHSPLIADLDQVIAKVHSFIQESYIQES